MVLFSPVPPPIYFHLIKVEKHPDKTFIDRIAKGFDFLAYNFEPKGLSIAPKTLANFLERKTQLYEQGADVRRIGQYVRNWWRWVRAGVEISVIYVFTDLITSRP